MRIWRRVGKTDWNTWEFLTSLQGPDEITVSSTSPSRLRPGTFNPLPRPSAELDFAFDFPSACPGTPRDLCSLLEPTTRLYGCGSVSLPLALGSELELQCVTFC